MKRGEAEVWELLDELALVSPIPIWVTANTYGTFRKPKKVARASGFLNCSAAFIVCSHICQQFTAQRNSASAKVLLFPFPRVFHHSLNLVDSWSVGWVDFSLHTFRTILRIIQFNFKEYEKTELIMVILKLLCRKVDSPYNGQAFHQRRSCVTEQMALRWSLSLPWFFPQVNIWVVGWPNNPCAIWETCRTKLFVLGSPEIGWATTRNAKHVVL